MHLSLIVPDFVVVVFLFLFVRWLVLTFKREFSFADGLTMFEIISSQHLELSSMEAERERERQRAKELERDGKRIHDREASI